MCAQTLFCQPRVTVVVCFLWFSLFVERRLKCERQRKERERGEKTEARSVSEAWKRRSPKHFNHFQKRKEKKKTYQLYIVNDQNKGTSSPTGKDCTVVGCVCMYVCVCVYSANLHYQKKKKNTESEKGGSATPKEMHFFIRTFTV